MTLRKAVKAAGITAAAAAVAAILVAQAASTGQPRNGANAGPGYAQRGIVSSPLNGDDMQQQDARY